MTPYDHRGQLVEAVECASCNSSLEWHGRLPEDPADVLCSDCCIERLTARAEAAEGALSDAERRGAAAYEGLMGMARIIGARERAKPPPPLDGTSCGARNGRYRCNSVHDYGPHKAISPSGRVLAEWS